MVEPKLRPAVHQPSWLNILTLYLSALGQMTQRFFESQFHEKLQGKNLKKITFLCKVILEITFTSGSSA
jgi:hypothetical protein